VKPMWIIKQYSPFIDEDSQTTLSKLVGDSTSYYDFIHRIVDSVLENESSVDLVFIAASHAWQIKERKLTDAIAAKYGHLVCIRPWCHVHGVSQFYQLDLQQQIKSDLDHLIESSVDDWMVLELLLWNSFDVYSHLEATRKLSTAEDIMNRNPDLKCFEYLYYTARGLSRWQEGFSSENIELSQKAVEVARLQQNAFGELWGLLNGANTMKSYDLSKSFEMFEKAYQIAQDLEVPFIIADLLSDYSMAYEMSGEYDLAISSQLEGQRLYNEGGMEIPYMITSRIYAALGDGQKSLEWANRAIEHNPSYGLLHLRKAQSLIILNRLDEAEEILNVASKISLKTGLDRNVARYSMALGQFEMAKGELLTAMTTLEQAYEISSRMRDGTTLNEVMISLAKVELAQRIQSKTSDVAGPGKWLSALEDHADKHNLPGISMQAAILKAELFQSQGQLKDASETLQQALEISDSPGVSTLKKKITIRIQELKQLLSDEERVS